MADYLPGFQDEWMTIINAVWTEIILPGTATPSNFFTALQMLKKNIEARMEDASPALPYAFMTLGTGLPSNVTSDRNDKNMPVTIFYVDSEKNGATQLTISSKLQAMDEYLRTRVNTTFCQIGDAVVDSSDLNAVNSTLSTLSQIRCYGGTITFPNIYTARLT